MKEDVVVLNLYTILVEGKERSIPVVAPSIVEAVTYAEAIGAIDGETVIEEVTLVYQDVVTIADVVAADDDEEFLDESVDL